MATLNLLPRKEFEIVLDDITIKGQFGTWSLKRFCDKLGLTLKDAGEALANPNMTHVTEYILCAVEYSARKTASPFSYTDVHACDWIDQLGGLAGDNFLRLFTHSGDESQVEDEQKKTAA